MICKAFVLTAVAASAWLVGSADEVTFSRHRLFPGYDGKTCKVQPSVATDGRGTVLLTWQNLLLSGSDVFFGESMARSTDGGKTFSSGARQEVLSDAWEGKIRTAFYGNVFYSRKNGRWYGLGAAQRYENDKVPMLRSPDGKPATVPMYYTVNAEKGVFTSKRRLDVPFDYVRTLPFGQVLECADDDLLVPFYVCAPGRGDKSCCIIVRYRFGDEGLVPVKAGTPLADDAYPRGIGEPSLAKLDGKFYLTLRTDVQGLWAESDDGMAFSKPQPWRWDDGSLLENYNTQQHWLRPDGALYLAYTRKGAHNDHVFRHRAPIFMAKFDPVRKCLVRSTEVILVPELGARLGNFNVIENGPNEAWLVTAEWMQSWHGHVCSDYGSDNSIWLAKVKFCIPRSTSRGALCLTFDDRNFAGWERNLPRFRKYGAHATFFVNGPIDGTAVATMKRLHADGHSLGLHGRTHAKAADLMKNFGEDEYLLREVEPQVAAAKAAGLEIRNWGYPMSSRTDETDAVLARRFRHLRTGCIWRKAIKGDPISNYDQVFVPRGEAGSRQLLWGTPIPSLFDSYDEDVVAALRRAHDRDEVVVLYAHNIRNDGRKDGHDISDEQLERILVLAREIGVAVIGFDEL